MAEAAELYLGGTAITTASQVPPRRPLRAPPRTMLDLRTVRPRAAAEEDADVVATALGEQG